VNERARSLTGTVGEDAPRSSPDLPMRVSPPWELLLDADATALVSLRHRSVRWLRQLRWPEAPIADAVLALDAAVSNAVQHAYPDPGGHIRVHALAASDGSGRSAARFTVRDWGRWRPRDPSWTGYGLALMAELSEELSSRPAMRAPPSSSRHRSSSPSPVAVRSAA